MKHSKCLAHVKSRTGYDPDSIQLKPRPEKTTQEGASRRPAEWNNRSKPFVARSVKCDPVGTAGHRKGGEAMSLVGETKNASVQRGSLTQGLVENLAVVPESSGCAA